MIVSAVYNEGSSFDLSVDFLDELGVAIVPTSVDYMITCKATNSVILASQSVTPALSVSITVLSTQNAVIDSTLPVETHEVTFTAGYGTGLAKTSEYVFGVKNLYAIP